MEQLRTIPPIAELEKIKGNLREKLVEMDISTERGKGEGYIILYGLQQVYHDIYLLNNQL